jgi:hypothetical protein
MACRTWDTWEVTVAPQKNLLDLRGIEETNGEYPQTDQGRSIGAESECDMVDALEQLSNLSDLESAIVEAIASETSPEKVARFDDLLREVRASIVRVKDSQRIQQISGVHPF